MQRLRPLSPAAKLSAVLCLVALVPTLARAQHQAFRPPAAPLVTHDPYFSVWSMSDRLTDSWPKHWTGKNMGVCGMVRIDGKAYRWCGPEPRDVPAMEQVGIVILPTVTAYRFRQGDLTLSVLFVS